MSRLVLVAVAVGGAIGASLRHAVSVAVPPPTSGFPWSTFVINVVGTFLLALLPASALVRRSRVLPPLLGTGVLGGFTTLSTWSVETRDLYAAGRSGLAMVYVVGTLSACLLAVLLADRAGSAANRARFDEEEGDL